MKIYDGSMEKHILCYVGKKGELLESGCGIVCPREQYRELSKRIGGNDKYISLALDTNELPTCGGLPKGIRFAINGTAYYSLGTDPCPKAKNFLFGAARANDFSPTTIQRNNIRVLTLLDEENIPLVKVDGGIAYRLSRDENKWIRMRKLKI